jgi:DNA-binding NarL/FixJ family response regulator
MPVKIALVDDNRINRNTFAGKIQTFDDLEISFIADNGDNCLNLLKELSPEKRPEVLFVDIEMPDLNGIQLIQIAKVLYPAIHYIVLTVFDDDERIFEAIRAGAKGYLLKDENAISLHNAITNCLEQGGAPMSPSIARKALELLSKASLRPEGMNKGNGEAPKTGLEGLLSDREKEVLQYTVKGYAPRQIADQLYISLFTVRKHIANIYEKLHVNSNSQIINLAYKNKWI